MNGNVRHRVRAAAHERQVLRVLYRGKKDATAVWRDIEVYDFDGTYIDARCRRSGERRTFRFDRIQAAELLETYFEYDPVLAERVHLDGWADKVDSWRRAQLRRLERALLGEPPFSV